MISDFKFGSSNPPCPPLQRGKPAGRKCFANFFGTSLPRRFAPPPLQRGKPARRKCFAKFFGTSLPRRFAPPPLQRGQGDSTPGFASTHALRIDSLRIVESEICERSEAIQRTSLFLDCFVPRNDAKRLKTKNPRQSHFALPWIRYAQKYRVGF